MELSIVILLVAIVCEIAIMGGFIFSILNDIRNELKNQNND